MIINTNYRPDNRQLYVHEFPKYDGVDDSWTEYVVSYNRTLSSEWRHDSEEKASVVCWEENSDIGFSYPGAIWASTLAVNSYLLFKIGSMAELDPGHVEFGMFSVLVENPNRPEQTFLHTLTKSKDIAYNAATEAANEYRGTQVLIYTRHHETPGEPDLMFSLLIPV